MTTYCVKDLENPMTRDQALEYFKKNPREYLLHEFDRSINDDRIMSGRYNEWVSKPSDSKRDTTVPNHILRDCQALEFHDENEIQKIWNEGLDKLDTECYKMMISKVTSDDFTFRGYDNDRAALKYLFMQMKEQQKRIDELENIISTLVHK